MNKGINIQLIIEGCLKGHAPSEQKLFESYYAYVKSICLRYAGNLEEAEEMLNDTFYKVFRYLERYDQEQRFLPWLRKVCINACLEYNRKYLQKIAIEPLEKSMEETIGPDHDFFELDPQVDVSACLRLLSPAYRTIFNLYVIEEYKHHEIAEILSISVNTSKSNLSRAKEVLKKHLAKSQNTKTKSNTN